MSAAPTTGGDATGRALAAGVAAATVVAAAFLAAAPAEIWLALRAGAPNFAALAGAAVYVAAVLLLPSRTPTALRRVVLAAAFGATVGCLRAYALGDRMIWMRFPYLGVAYASEGMSGGLQVVAHALAGLDGQRALAPVAGVLACLAWQVAADAILDPAPSRAARRTLDLAWVATPFPLAFAFDYVENAQWALAPTLMSLAALVRATRADATDAARRRGALLAGAWAGIAVATHGVACAFAPAVPLALATASRAGRGLRDVPKDVVAAAVAAAAAVGACFAVLAAAGLRIEPGHARLESNWFCVPWSTEGYGPRVRFAFATLEHAREVANIVLFGAPLALGALVAGRPFFAVPAAATWAALGFVGFATLFNFTLPFPLDFDLMLVLGATLQLRSAAVLAAGAATRPGRFRAGVALVAAGVASWALIGGHSRAPWDATGQANAPEATLRVAGIGDDGAPGPFEVVVDAAAPAVDVVVVGPPGADVVLLVGAPAPFAIDQHFPARFAAGPPRFDFSRLHVGSGASFDDPFIVRTPVKLDAAGRFVHRWTSPPLAPGPVPNGAVQALVFGPPGDPRPPRLTAAFVLVAR